MGARAATTVLAIGCKLKRARAGLAPSAAETVSSTLTDGALRPAAWRLAAATSECGAAAVFASLVVVVSSGGDSPRCRLTPRIESNRSPVGCRMRRQREPLLNRRVRSSHPCTLTTVSTSSAVRIVRALAARRAEMSGWRSEASRATFSSAVTGSLTDFVRAVSSLQ